MKQVIGEIGKKPYQNETLDSPSPYGAYDMTGNVWEWTTSRYDSSNSSRPIPTNWLVLRGGWFDPRYSDSEVTLMYPGVSYPNYLPPLTRYGGAGFRCAQ